MLDIINKTKQKIPKIYFQEIKDKILGDNYELSLVFVTPGKIKETNRIYRGKKEVTDVLSFELEKNSGEIFICPTKAKQKSKDFEMDYDKYFLFLLIHACLHLKGMQHSSKMNIQETKFLKFFNEKRYSSRN